MKSNLWIVLITIIISVTIIRIEQIKTEENKYIEKDEYIKQLEQSLNEQLQEIEVYRNLLYEEKEVKLHAENKR